ncbi:MAG: hypothetical protein ACM3JF_03275 [Sphaerimonospora mesophila]
MFKKLVSNLPFSPSLVGQLGFYAQRLKKEEAIRRLGLIFTVFALVIQSIAVFNPPESANAATGNDMCPGVTANAAGAKKVKDCYNNNTRHFKDVLSFFGIKKDDLWKALDGSASFRSTSTYGNWYTFGHVKRFSGDKNFSGQVPGDLYARKWNHKNNIDNGQYGWKGKSSGKDFIILVNCGNLALKELPNPSAKCVSLTASKTDITAGDAITLTAKASTNDGADISKYNFSQTGPENATNSVKTSATSATWNRTLTKAGTYQFAVSVDTSNAGSNLTSNGCKATVVVKEKVTPKAVCEDLTVIPSSGKKGTTFKITAKASVSGGATIKQYNFTAKGPASYSWSNPTSNTTSTWSLTPEQAGSYNTSVSVDTSVGAVTAPACNASFTVTETSNPSAECKLLSVEQVSRTQYKLSATASTTDGATVTGYSYVIKDASGKVVKQSGKISQDTWTVDLPDNTSLTNAVTYKAILTVHTSLGDKTSANCEKEITIPAVEKCEYNPELPADDENCKPDCDTNPDMEGCTPEIELIKTAVNRSQGDKDATTVRANGSDVIVYTITIKNHGKTAGTIELNDMLVDTLEYGTVTDNGGAIFDEATKTLSWGEITVEAGATTTRSFVVTVNNPVPSTAQNHGTPESYDCIMTNTVAEDSDAVVSIPVNCPAVKEVVEQTIIKQIPATGAGDNLLFGGLVAAIVVFFYARSRQLGKEVRLVRREFNAGTL